MAEPAEKRQKTGEGEQAEEKKPDAEMKEAEAPKVAEPPKELEVDAPACSKPKLKEPVTFLTPDTTLNLMHSAQGNVLMSMNEGGIRHFFAGARANVGVSKGRYMFEVKIMEFVNVADASHQSLAAKNVVRVGFSTQGSSLVLGSGAENICFDSAGAMLHNDVRTLAGAKCFRDSIMTVLLNLDKDSPNFNTISLFKDGQRACHGKRACQPQPLPDSLKGKTLFPHVSFKNATVHVNFGAVPLAPLPFTCRMVQDATKADTSATKHEAPADGKYEVVYPVSLPDEGTFDWLDTFLEKNKSYTELSDRAILNWASQSGLWRQKGHSVKSCNDRPDKNFQAPELNDDSVRKAVYSIAPLQARNYIVMEVKGNLMEDERKLLLDRFRSPAFKKIACVVVGEPTVEFKKHSQKLILQQKQEASDKQFNAKKLEEKRKKIIEQKQKEMEKLKKKAEKEKKQKEREAKKKAAEEKGEKLEEEEEEKEDEEDKEEEEEVEKEEEPPKAELTDEEKKMSFVKRDIKDLTPVVMSAAFAKFTLPTKDEGFDDIKYEWAKGAKCDEYLKKWILERKLSMRIEDLQPSTWFNQQWAKWQMAVKAWQSKLAEYKTVVAKKAAAKAAKEAKKAAAAKKAAEKKEGDEKEEKKEDTEAMEVEEEEKEEEEESIDFEALDVFGVDDILNVGAETPLFKEYQMEDWAMLSLRFELHILAHAFRKDVNDPERMGIHLDHLAFYYNRYFKKALSPKDYGVDPYYQQGGYKQQGYGKAQQQGKDGGKGGQSYRPYGWGGNKGGKASGKAGGQTNGIESLAWWVSPPASISLGDVHGWWADERCLRASNML
eukprot:CAMPEP_0115554716 /NCGR_PEP_ID=MMETSP0271-20121206/97439_1 /TAXON_ID=71861 /ORGANISM="Scrippsiella trochoidea, Strain CCMP3099" /LENGTH=830 /DNA_ID=CAMNT_0002988455 /DNA_START=96 /DNA_END=2590 /DNA_ORIENTATION=+